MKNGLKRIFIPTLSALILLFACENPQNDVVPPSNNAQEFMVNFSVEGEGGTLTAKVKDGDAITTGKKVSKDMEVVFTAQADAGYDIENWILDGNEVNGTEKDYTLKITKQVNLILKFKENGDAKNISIEKITLGYPNISERDGKEIKGDELNENTVIGDFDVPSNRFPIHVWHKKEFTVEKVYVTYQGKRKQLNGEISKTFFVQDYTLVENVKTPFIIDIEGEGYNPLKLTFNVTYKNTKVRYMDDITIIGITKNKQNKQITFGFVGDKNINELLDGKTTIDISRSDPIISILTERKGGEQPKLEMKVDNNLMTGIDFEVGTYSLETQLSSLTKGMHNIKIKIEKDGWVQGNYDFNLNYKPFFTFKSLTVNGNSYTTLSSIKEIILDKNAPNPVTLSGKMNEEGAIISFKKKEDKKYVDFDPPLEVEVGKTISCRIYASLDDYTTTYYNFKLTRKD